MTTENTHTVQNPGPVRVEIEVLSGKVTVGASLDVSRATVTVHTVDTQGATADAVTGTGFVEYGNTLKVKIPNTGDSEAPAGSPHAGTTVHNVFRGRVGGDFHQAATFVQAGRTTVQTAGGVRGVVFTQNGTDNFQVFGGVRDAVFTRRDTGDVRTFSGVRDAVFSQSGLGNVQMDDGTLYINGIAIVRDGVVVVPEGTRVDALPRTIHVDIQLPPGSEVSFTSSGSASLALNGDFHQVEAILADGAMSAAKADIGTVSVSTITGNITLGHTRDTAVLHSDTGDIDVHRFGGGTLTATTSAGDIDIQAPSGVPRPASVTLNSVTGDIDTDGLVGLSHVRLTAHSHTGEVHHSL
ncbi:DUF4097 family beta strand repeat-containing protein [Kitasatospora sp. NPDC127060]|uniref:DUF4097 family beta strand repeat-containing protein n=1 Tax=Kitasatospora sp. NPDC127060 TaxID=3347121 RepID=UPI003667D794